ncbi:hypothetical protein ACH5RR_024999 [Cinchona calisaya]|uniref:Peptidase A1 domain-containing protein n=1 Tax=Cinchona calisaya TaxID=153742 RepID=A0ABD2Z2G8_9GENT
MDFIHSKLNPAQSKVSQHKPHLQLSVISGISQRIPEYLARIGVGSPVKDLYVLIDTGSSLNWIQCVPCFHCNHAIFNPLKSSSFRRLSCTSPKCAAIRSHTCTSGNTCIYGMEYAHESMTIGELASETLTFGCSSKVDNVAIGCGHNSSGNVEGIDGIFGFSPSILSLPSQIKATSFSYCLVDSDSTSSSTLDFNLIPPKDSIIVPMVINSNPRFNGFDSFFYVEVIGISVGRERLSIAPSVFQIDKNGNEGVIVDSGTTVTVLPPEAYRPLREVFTKHMRRSPLPGNISLFDTCYDLSLVDYAAIPTISFHFSGGKTLVLGPRNCLTAVDSKGTFCLSFLQNYLPVSFSILGNSQQQGIRISFDLTNKLIGFSPNKC